jgi:hypothetical protein
MSDDPFKDPWFIDFAKRVNDDLVPKIKDSELTISLNPTGGEADVKFAVELGFSIMLNKPIIVVATPGGVVPVGLARVAHRVLFLDLADPDSQKVLTLAIEAVIEEFQLNKEET